MLAYNKLVQEKEIKLKSLSEFSEENVEGKKEESFKESNLKEAYEKYKDMPEDELLKTLFTEVDKQKQNGTFNFENLKSLVESMAPMLTSEQLNNINILLEKMR